MGTPMGAQGAIWVLTPWAHLATPAIFFVFDYNVNKEQMTVCLRPGFYKLTSRISGRIFHYFASLCPIYAE